MGGVSNGLFGGSGAADDAAAAQLEAARLQTKEAKRQFNLTRKDFKPFRETGTEALAQQRSILGLGGEAEQQVAFDAFKDSPGQAFLRERGEKALLRNQSAIGGLGGGNVRSALQQQGIGFANQQFGEFQNRLASLSGQGQTATSTGAQIGAGLSGQIQSGLLAQGEARSSGILGAQQANAAMVQQLVGLASAGAGAGSGFSDIRLKECIKRTGELESGLSTYSWSWRDFAKKLVDNQPAFGVMAHEAKVMFPNAVTLKDGYLYVNYAEIS